MSKHALLSPSSAHCWAACVGAPALYQGMPDTSSVHSREGSCAHHIGELVLLHEHPATHYIGTVSHDTEVDADMAEHVQSYADIVRQYLLEPTDELHVEVTLDISQITTEPDAAGTSDAVILSHVHREITVIDLKYGRGERVQVEENWQLMLYGLAALLKFELVGNFDRVRLVIIQPRNGGVSEWSISADQLRAFGDWINGQAMQALALLENRDAALQNLTPGEKQCRWCKAKAICPALKEAVLAEEQVVPADTTDIGALLDRIGMIEDWCRAVRHEAERRLINGEPVHGYKLVEGKRGNRAWASNQQVLSVMKSMRIPAREMYEQKLISPTEAQKRIGKKHPRRWTALQSLIVQKPGSPTVAPASDPRPAIAPASVDNEFEPLGEEA